MTEKELIKLLKYPILPYPWQSDGKEYPEWDKYGELFELAQRRDGTAASYVEAYNGFVNKLKELEKDA